MACKNCNCGKREQKTSSVLPVEEPNVNKNFLNRLYLLGWLMNPTNRFNLNDEDEVVQNELVKLLPNDAVIENSLLVPKSEELKKLITRTKDNNFAEIYQMLKTLPQKDKRHFWRGYLDFVMYVPNQSREVIEYPNRLRLYPSINFVFQSKTLLSALLEFLEISECDANINEINEFTILEVNGSNALDLLHDLYVDTSVIHRRTNWIKYIKSTGAEDENVQSAFKFMKKRPDAVAPFKARPSDSGYDLTILEKIKTVGEVEFYDTGITLIPAYGYYFDVVPRSSISKTGYILVNSMGVIDQSYRASVLVPLIKIDKSMPDLTLPNRIVQAIPRKIVHLDFQEVYNSDKTFRNEGGFGSSNVQ